MIHYSDWYFSWGWLLITVAGCGVGMWSATRREWGVLILWLALALTLGFGATMLKHHWIT